MADNHNCPVQGVIVQERTVGQDSLLNNSPPRGPRTLLLRRGENGFGFTLRHFIVYPPESCYMLPGHERTNIDEPMDTIFVKQVRPNSPAAEAGLRTGDRVVSVDGAPTRGEQYASVVQRIQQAGAWLRLLVVSKEDDILQKYFGETAHNPETNQRPRLRSPERLSQKQRKSIGILHGNSSRARQSWVCSSSPGSESQGMHSNMEHGSIACVNNSPIEKRMHGTVAVAGSSIDEQKLAASSNTHCKKSSQENSIARWRSTSPSGVMASTVATSPTAATTAMALQYRRKDSGNGSSEAALRSASRAPFSSHYDVDCFHMYDPRNSRPGSVYSRADSERIYDRIKDPIYERVKPDKSFTESLDRHQFPVSRAEPQVPIYRAIGKRVVTRRASEGSGSTNDPEHFESYGSAAALGQSRIDSCSGGSIGSRLSIDDTPGGSCRDSISPTSKDSFSSFDSNSTLTGNNSECPGDSVIISRIRKSFEQKEEFLRRPSHPIGWFISEDSRGNAATAANSCCQYDSSQCQVQQQSRSDKLIQGPQGIIQREFYARPQKLQKQVWPPGEMQVAKQSNSPTRLLDQWTKAQKPGSIQHSSKSKSTESESYASPRLRNDDSGSAGNNNNNVNNSVNNNHNSCSSTNGNSKIAAFVSTLSRIHENVTSTAQQQDLRNGTSSLPSSPGLDKKNGDKFPVPPQGLQIVSRRTKQFESGRLVSDDDECVIRDRTNLYKSELSRLSNKRSVPNVAVRKREFESKAESHETRRVTVNRESKSLEAGSALSGNRTIPIGSKNIHCEPPADHIKCKEPTANDTELVQLRVRSNSVESWTTNNEPLQKSVRHTWQNEPEDEPEDKRNITAKRQDSYLQAVREQLGSNANASNNGVVLRRQKKTQLSDEDRTTRRVSYLKATWGERMHIDSDLELSDSEPVHTVVRDDIPSIQNLPSENVISRDVHPTEREGLLNVKFTVLDGKRSTDRSWKQMWGVLRGPILYFYKDRHSQSPSTTNEGDTVSNVDTRCSVVDVADDYTKRKNVLRVANTSVEVLLQTEDTVSMALWLRALQKHAAAEKPSDATSTTSKQLAVPQTPGPTTSSANGLNQTQRLSPLPSHKGIRKLTSFRNRSPTGQSPVSKTRKPSQNIEPLSPSPKSKTWKGRVAKQFRKMQSQAGSPSSPTTQLPPNGATFKVPLEFCRPSSFSEYVPLIVEMCTKIVEARGLEVIGIYRVPGNTAAISQLTDSVNKGFENINLQDPRWSDVNVISSLLKSFFRQLPDSLLTSTLYPMFIDADKIEDPQRRMATIRKLLRDLPEHHFETLKHLMYHLKKVVEHSEANKMESKNLAIVFGPTLVRASGSRDNMMTMVTDMSHQCRIVESLLNNVDWFFSDEDSDDLSRLSVNLSLPADNSDMEVSTNHANHNLLLNNIQKVEAGMREMMTAKDIVSSIISAANRKIQRRKKGHDEADNDDHEDEKQKTKHEETAPVIRQSMALNERLCSVSEIVMMHENKNVNNHATKNTNESSDFNAPNVGVRPKYSSCSHQQQLQEKQQSEQQLQLHEQRSVTSSCHDGSKFTADSSNISDRISVISNGSNETKQSNDEVTIRSYAGLSATTQERIRRFEQETKAMLQRDQHRHRREAEKREEEKRRIELEWQLAKREMEDEDILDNIVDTTITPTFMSDRWSNLTDRFSERVSLNLTDRVRSKSSTRVSSLPTSIAAKQQRQKAQTGNQLNSAMSDKNIDNSAYKKLKTDKEISQNASLLTPSRYGSLDSLHEFHASSKSSSSPSAQHRSIPGDLSDDGSDLLTSLTSTFDRKWKSLINPSSTSAVAPTQTSSPSSTSIFDKLSNDTTDIACKIDEDNNGIHVSSRCSTEVYRDPSLHKAPLEQMKSLRLKNDTGEKNSCASKKTGTVMPDNDRGMTTSRKTVEHEDGGSDIYLDATEKDENLKVENVDDVDTSKGEERQQLPLIDSTNKNETCDRPDDLESIESSETRKSVNETADVKTATSGNSSDDPSYSNKLKRFESLSKANLEPRSRLKRSESLNKRTESNSSKLKRSESLNKHSYDRSSVSSSNCKLKRSESLNKQQQQSPHSDCTELNIKLKRSESLTKTEKTESNISKRRQSVRKESTIKLKRKNGMPERSIKRRHTVGGTKDFDKVHWLDNKLQAEGENIVKSGEDVGCCSSRPVIKKSQLRTSSPDLSSNRYNVPDTSFLIEVSFRGPSNVIFNVTNARPQSLPDANLASKVFKVPLESHV